MAHSLYIGPVIGARREGFYAIGANFLLLQRDFQQNKDCNATYSLWARSLPPVAEGLPAKQGLQLCRSDRFRVADVKLQRDFQQNKDCNLL